MREKFADFSVALRILRLLKLNLSEAVVFVFLNVSNLPLKDHDKSNFSKLKIDDNNSSRCIL